MRIADTGLVEKLKELKLAPPHKSGETVFAELEETRMFNLRKRKGESKMSDRSLKQEFEAWCKEHHYKDVDDITEEEPKGYQSKCINECNQLQDEYDEEIERLSKTVTEEKIKYYSYITYGVGNYGDPRKSPNFEHYKNIISLCSKYNKALIPNGATLMSAMNQFKAEIDKIGESMTEIKTSPSYKRYCIDDGCLFVCIDILDIVSEIEST